jgi:hypothetical protein
VSNTSDNIDSRVLTVLEEFVWQPAQENTVLPPKPIHSGH